MKKVLILFSAIALLTTACEKEEVQPMNDTNKIKPTSTNNKVSGGDDPIYVPTNYRFLFDEIRYPTGCVKAKGDCFPVDIVISGLAKQNADDLFDAINSANQVLIQNEFADKSQYLIDIMAKEMPLDNAQLVVDMVVDGGLQVSAIYNTENTDRFMVFKYTSNGEQTLVLPFVE